MAIKKKKENKIGRASFFNNMIEESKRKFPDNTYLGTEFKDTMFGIPLPSLALQYMFTSNVFLLGKMVGLSGPSGSNKSAFGYELLRLFYEANGFATILETENKTAEPFVQSVIGAKNMPFLNILRADTVEEAQDQATSMLETYKKFCPSEDIPYGLLVDSIIGSKSESTAAAIIKDGHASRSYSEEALILSTYFGTLVGMLSKKPITYIFTNHEKQKLGAKVPTFGPTPVSNPGGAALKFHSTYQFRLQNIGKLTSKTNPGNVVKITCTKNSAGETNRSVEVEFRWSHYRDENDDLVQTSIWDWNKATAELLASDKVPRNELKDVVNVIKDTNTKFNCSALGLKGEPPEVVGKAINEDQKIMHDLQTVLGIFNYRTFMGAVDEESNGLSEVGRGDVSGEEESIGF